MTWSTSKSVLILSRADDLHATTVRDRVVARGFPCSIVDTSWDEPLSLAGIIDADVECSLSLGAVTVDSGCRIWWRRPHSPAADDRLWDERVRSFLASERKFGLHGLLFAAAQRIINDPFREASANYKPRQLAAARKVGLAVPRTCITNRADVAREFIEDLRRQGRRAIFKPLSPSRYHMAETRLVVADQIRDAELQMAPVIFQECVEKGEDVRVCVVGGKQFAATVKTDHEELVDWRIDPLASYEARDLDNSLRNRLGCLVEALGLESGSIDLRVDRDGTPYFLEINPSGQFLFLEADLGYAVTDAFAELLTG